ncbi:MAG: DUF1573 domain-containing protein [Ignavibacteriaceae bacterium]|nr:DUF1573 domain-containing protein [Ignavibacteriaceae bacterium]
MKIILFTLLMFTALIKAQELPLTTAELTETTYDFGDVSEGEKVTYTVFMKNTGTNPLIIEDVKPSKGFITPDWKRGEVAPGDKAFIKIEVDTKGKIGLVKGNIKIVSNIETGNLLFNFSVNVVAP